ncbi:hypothetical protein [Microbacterium maritypicum]|uniref:hypothetical protein n=1 Tax=Microbacterium maritypicum TaxID=33918 RepID=UPI003A9556E8
MTDKKKLIEEARRAYLDAWAETNLADVPPGTRSRNGIIAALAVFEKAHTPTDDERQVFDAIADRLGEHSQARNYEIADSGEYETRLRGPVDVEVLSEWLLPTVLGFCRSEVPEPSAEGPAFIAIMPPSPETSNRWYSMYCRVCGVEEMMADTADDPRLLDRRDEHNRERHAEPQGEPSDARAKVIDALVMTRLSDFAGTDMGVIEQAADAVLAALRAAGVGGVR